MKIVKKFHLEVKKGQKGYLKIVKNEKRIITKSKKQIKINKYQMKEYEEKYIKLKECDEIKVKKCQKFNKNPTDRKGCDKRGECAKVEKMENEKAKSV